MQIHIHSSKRASLVVINAVQLGAHMWLDGASEITLIFRAKRGTINVLKR